MKAQQFHQLKVGNKVRVTSDRNIASANGIEQFMGRETTVSRLDSGNNQVYLNDCQEYVFEASDLELVNGKKSNKVERYGRKNIDTLFIQGGNDAIKREMTTRVHSIKNEITDALISTPANLFKSTMKSVDENIRQLKLLQRNLRKQ